jgi:hypothetical protein
MTWQQARHQPVAWTPLQKLLQATGRLARALQSGVQRCVWMRPEAFHLNGQWS